jgi:hypothetical protein
MTYYILKMLSWVGLVWDLRKPPQRILDEGRRGNPAPFVKVTEEVAKPKAKSADVPLLAPEPAE